MQIAFSPVFDLYHNHDYIITFSTFRSLVFTNGRFLFLTCYCATCSSMFLCMFLRFYKSEKTCFYVFYLQTMFLTSVLKSRLVIFLLLSTFDDLEGHYALLWLNGTSYLRKLKMTNRANVAINHLFTFAALRFLAMYSWAFCYRTHTPQLNEDKKIEAQQKCIR